MIASDIDQVAVEIAKENAQANGEGPLVNAFTADGLVHPALAAAAPYDLLIANILAAPLTFLAVAGRRVQLEIFTKFSIPINITRVMHRDQKFHFHRPIRVGDALTGTMHVESVEERFGADIVTTRNVCAGEDGTIVMEAYTTLMGHQGDNSISVRWDKETGQVVRTAATD